VPGALGRYLQAAVGGEPDRGADVLGCLGEDDRGGLLVDGEVPGAARLVESLVSGADGLALQPWADLNGAVSECWVSWTCLVLSGRR